MNRIYKDVVAEKLFSFSAGRSLQEELRSCLDLADQCPEQNSSKVKSSKRHSYADGLGVVQDLVQTGEFKTKGRITGGLPVRFDSERRRILANPCA
jgi:hypothetical protein